MDTSEKGDLASCRLMGNFSNDPLNNFDFITADDRMTYSFNIRDDGNLLEIVSLGCKLTVLYYYHKLNNINWLFILKYN